MDKRENILARNRKADMDTAIFVIMVDLLIVFMLLTFMLQFIGGIEDNTIFEKKFLAQDIAMFVNAIYSIPTDIYQKSFEPGGLLDISRFNYKFDEQGNSRVVVSRTGEKSAGIHHPFGLDTTISHDFDELSLPEKIYIEKYDDTIYIASESSISQRGYSCSASVDTSDNSWRSKTIYIDPGTGLNDNIWYDSEIKDKGIMWDISSKMIRSAGFGRMLTTSTDDKLSVAEKRDKIKGSHILISMHPASASEDIVPVRVYYNSGSSNYLKNKKLACLIVKEFYNDDELKRALGDKNLEVSIFPLSSSMLDSLSSSDPRKVLSTSGLGDDAPVAVLLEIGNANIKQTEGIFSGKAKTTARIFDNLKKALEAYHE